MMVGRWKRHLPALLGLAVALLAVTEALAVNSLRIQDRTPGRTTSPNFSYTPACCSATLYTATVANTVTAVQLRATGTQAISYRTGVYDKGTTDLQNWDLCRRNNGALQGNECDVQLSVGLNLFQIRDINPVSPWRNCRDNFLCATYLRQVVTLQIIRQGQTATLAVSPSTVTEGGANNTATVSATLASTSTAATTITVTPVAGRYTVGDATIVIPAGSTTSTDTATVTAVDDLVDAVAPPGFPEGSKPPAYVTGTATNSYVVVAARLAITDDDTRGFVFDADASTAEVDAAPVTVNELASDNTKAYSVRLATEPTGTVTITANIGDGTYAVFREGGNSFTTRSLTFSTSNWDTAQSLTVRAEADDNGINQAVTIAHTATGGDYASVTGNLAVTVVDDDTPAVLMDTNPSTTNVDDPGPVTLDELATSSTNQRSYTLRLSSEPTQDVTVTVTSDDTAHVTVDTSTMSGLQSTLTFTSSNWNTAQTVTLAAVDDDDTRNETATITNAAATASSSEYTSVSTTLTVNVNDDDMPGFVFDADPTTPATDNAGPLALQELMSGTNSANYSVRLAAEPTYAVTVTLTNPDAGAVGVGDTDSVMPGVQNTLTFTVMNWDTAQTVSLTALQDDDGDDESVAITHTGSTTPASEFSGVTADFTASVDDDETKGVALSASTLTVSERDSGTYTVRLATEPVRGNVTVAITGAADSISVRPTSLTFTAGNWDTARTVTVTAADDQDSTNDMVTLTHTPTGGDYDGVTAPELDVTATDDDQPSLRVSPTQLTVREDGSATYSIRLNTQPSATVTVTVGGATTEVTVDTDSITLGSQTTLTFNTGNWSTNQTVTVSAADDDDATNETVNLTHAATGGDYSSLPLLERPGVTVMVTDDDEPAILIDADPSTANMDEAGPLALNEQMGHADNSKGYTVRLATEPTAAVTVAVTSGDRAVAVDTDATPQTLSLSFTTGNWDTAQTVTARAAEDDDASNERVAISHAATGGDYGDVTAELIATTVDDDEPAIRVTATALAGSGVAEGATATYTVRLETEPAGVATVTVAVSGGPVSVDMDPQQAGVQSALRFDATTWDTARTVAVRGLPDDDAAGGTATLRHSASGADYGGVTAPDTTFAVTDDDAPAVMVSPTSVVANEGSTATYEVALAAAPTGGPATIAATSSDEAVATVSPASLTFTAGNWNQPQRFTVRGEEDDGSTAGAATITHAATGADYEGATVAPVAVAVRDDEAAGVRIEPPALALREGERGTYRIRLNTDPGGDATVTPTGGTDLAVDDDGTARTFTNANWNQPQTVALTVAEDDDAADEAPAVSHAVAGYAGVTTAPALTVRIADDDAPDVLFDPPGGVALVEGGSPATATYTAVLTAQPSGTVTVAVSSDDAGVEFDADDGTTGDQSSVAFDATNWNAPRTVEVRAVADGDAASETATLTHAASGGGYDVAAGYEVRLSDADAAAPPRNVRAESAGPRSLSVRWSASANAQGYLVQWRRPGQAWSAERQLEVPAGTTSARIAGLETGARYEVRVVGLNRGDPGDPSAVETAAPASTTGNRAPAITGALPAEVGLAIGETATLSLAAAFADPDGDELTYGALSSDSSVAAASVVGRELRLRGVAPGSADVTAWAMDPAGAEATARLRVLVGVSLALADAVATEGGTARVVAELSAARMAATTFAWRVGADLDPATADADAGEHGDAAGEATIAAGETRTVIEIAIADDDEIEPAREWFEVTPIAPADGCCVLQRPRTRVAVLEGVCDRTPAVRDALRGDTGCEAPTTAALAAQTRLSLAGASAGELQPKDFEGLSRLRTLDLAGNALATLPTGLFADLGALRELDLSRNALTALPPGPFAEMPRLRMLDLSANALATLPPGLFAGLANLDEASLERNPGAPFPLAAELARTDATAGRPSPATVEARFAAGAPFALRVPLTTEPANAAGLPAIVTIAAGATASSPFPASAPTGGALRLRLGAPTMPPARCGDEWPFRACFRGFAPMASPALALFRRPPRALPAPAPEPLAGDELRLPLASLVAAGDSPGSLRFVASSSDESVATARVAGRYLLVEPEPGAEGTTEIVVVATDSAGLAATLRFEVQVEFFARNRPTAGWRNAIHAVPQ